MNNHNTTFMSPTTNKYFLKQYYLNGQTGKRSPERKVKVTLTQAKAMNARTNNLLRTHEVESSYCF